jgi:hypothetical protein
MGCVVVTGGDRRRQEVTHLQRLLHEPHELNRPRLSAWSVMSPFIVT